MIVAPLFDRYSLKATFLFGSYARGEAPPNSNIDPLIDDGTSFEPLNVYALGEELRNAIGKRFDVFELTELDEGPSSRRP